MQGDKNQMQHAPTAVGVVGIESKQQKGRKGCIQDCVRVESSS